MSGHYGQCHVSRDCDIPICHDPQCGACQDHDEHHAQTVESDWVVTTEHATPDAAGTITAAATHVTDPLAPEGGYRLERLIRAVSEDGAVEQMADVLGDANLERAGRITARPA